jgi:hypothetical protein
VSIAFLHKMCTWLPASRDICGLSAVVNVNMWTCLIAP